MTGSYTEAVGRICDSETHVSTGTGAYGRGNLGFMVMVLVRPVKSIMVRVATPYQHMSRLHKHQTI